MMADQASTVAAISAARAEVAAIGVVVPPPPPPTGTGVLASLARNTARSMGSYVNPHPDWYQKGANITDDGGCAADPKRHQYLLMGGSHGRSQEDDVRAFDTLTEQWRSLYPSTLWADMLAANLDSVKGRWISTNQPVARHTYSQMVVRGDDLHVLQAYCNPQDLPQGQLPSFTGKLCKYDLAGTGGWIYSALTMPWYHASASVLDPVSQNIYVFGMHPTTFYGQIWKYDPAADSVTSGPQLGNNTQPLDAVHCPDDDKFYVFATGGDVLKVTIDRANVTNSVVIALATTGPKPTQAAEGMPTGRPRGYPSFTWDSVNKRMGGCFVDGIHYEFNPATLTWTATTVLIEAGSAGGSPPSNDFSCSAFDTASGCYIFVQIAPSGGPRTWAVRP